MGRELYKGRKTKGFEINHEKTNHWNIGTC